MLHESFGYGGWLLQGLLLAAGIAAPLLSTYALMSGRALPAFLDVLGPPKGRTPFFMTNMLGITLIVTTVIAAQIALSLVFDARWRDFPFAALTMAVVPFWTLAFLNRSRSGTRPLAEAVFAALFALAAVYIILNEGSENWQAMWTGAMYFVLAGTLWQARAAGCRSRIDGHDSRPSRGRPGVTRAGGMPARQVRLTPPARSHVPG